MMPTAASLIEASDQRFLNMRKKLIDAFDILRWFTALMVSGLLLGSGWAMDLDSAAFDSLQQRLIADGFNAELITELYANSQVSFDKRGVSLFFQHREASLDYDQFSSSKSINKAKAYMQENQQALAKAESTFGVDKEVITAILLVESRLGTVRGRRPVINSLSTIASLQDQAVREQLWVEIAAQSDYTREQYDKWVARRAGWAYAELKAFLEYALREQFDPVAITGSYAGALGYAQFMPSNVLAYAKDGNDDGSVDLFDHADAIASIASYLQHYGWRPGIEHAEASKVVYRYNHSRYYVEAILKISKLLKG